MQRHGPPPLFKRGLPAEARLAILVSVALFLLVVDSQWQVLDPVRRVISVVLYPFQRTVMAPRDLVQQINGWVNAANLIRSENEALQRQRIELAQVATHAAQVAAENAQLRRLLGITGMRTQPAVVVEVFYEPPTAFGHRLVFNKGANAGLAPGMPVIDEGGVVGQIIRVTPMTAEAALVTDEQVAIPVQVLRNGLRLIAFGSNKHNELEVRYLAADADIQQGDTLITSGLGGLFPAGLAVGKVTSVARDTASGFASAVCEPLGHPEHYRHFLVIQVDVAGTETQRQEADADGTN